MARRDVSEELRHDVLIDIAKGDERRFGTGGKMLKPSRATVEAALTKIPRGSVMTVTALRRQLAQQHRADTTCPFMTKRALMAIADDARATVPWWRIVKPDGAATSYFPGGAAAQMRRLKMERSAAK
jgi:alkylated DNA nucleotide flippase Atl1